jgi:hypothetical protein
MDGAPCQVVPLVSQLIRSLELLSCSAPVMSVVMTADVSLQV